MDPIWDLGQRIQKMLRANEQATNKLKIILEDQARQQGDDHQQQEPRLEEPDQATPHNDNNEDEDIIQTTPQPKKVGRRKMDLLNRLRGHKEMVDRQQQFKKNMENAGGSEASQKQATTTEEQSSNAQDLNLNSGGSVERRAVEERPNSQAERPACT